MERLSDFTITGAEMITSDKLLFFCNELNRRGANQVQYIKTDFVRARKGSIVIMIGWRGLRKGLNLRKIKVLVTGHADYDVNITYGDVINNQVLTHWFGQNMNIHHPKMTALPLGITNQHEPNSEIHRVIGDTRRIENVGRTPKEIENLVYMNITVGNWPAERQYIVERYGGETWVTHESGNITEAGHMHFLQRMRNHMFVLAPRGNGIDTHRLWEALYLGTIPIVKRCAAMEQFEDLPILFVDSWDGITEEWLEEKHEEMMSREYPLYKLRVSYWQKRIFEACGL